LIKFSFYQNLTDLKNFYFKISLLPTNLRELAGEHTRSGGCGLIGLNAEHLTRVDSRMKVLLTGVPDKLRGVAWPSSARTLRRAVKSVKT